ncbi:cytochrome c5 family protein [Aliiglaciecola litoralis]|uniref:Cytochrome c5 family protein n=1 Tax=Aliiglaciecola litoralis TaxID=582857 RepID=A0ABP3WX85_9ALTE
MKVKALLSVVVGSMLMFAAYAQNTSDDELIERIKPVGSVHIAGAQAESASAGPRSGADIYQSACFACHGTGALSAPKINVAAEWAPRLEQGFDTVWQNAIKGINAMPPMGGCMDCSEDDIKAAIEHMTKDI